MTVRNISRLAVSAAAAFWLAGCSSDGQILSTASVAPENTTVANTPRFDPICGSLASQIDALRKEGSIERLEKAADGKSKSVTIKRASLVKQAELNKAYANYQAKCGPQIPRAQTAQAPAPAAAQASATTAAQVAPIAPTATPPAAAPAATTPPVPAAAPSAN